MTNFTRADLNNYLETLFCSGIDSRHELEIEYYSNFLYVNTDILESVFEIFAEKHPEISKKPENSSS